MHTGGAPKFFTTVPWDMWLQTKELKYLPGVLGYLIDPLDTVAVVRWTVIESSVNL